MAQARGPTPQALAQVTMVPIEAEDGSHREGTGCFSFTSALCYNHPVNALWTLLTSPLGPTLILLIGAVLLAAAGRFVRRPIWLTGFALAIVAVAALLLLLLRNQPVVPEFSRPWQPLLQRGTNLLWIGDGWNWYVSGLILLLGFVGLLLVDSDDPNQPAALHRRYAIASTLAVHLGVLASALAFVGSGNLLTVTFTWVVMDAVLLARSSFHLHVRLDAQQPPPPRLNRAQGLSLFGALLLLIGLLPAGPFGLSQPLQGGDLPVETVFLLLAAAAIRTGAYPVHLWLLPTSTARMALPERLLNHMVPALCGLWLLGWAIELGGEFILLRPELLTISLLALLGCAVAAWTATAQPGHTTFVLITSAGLASLSGTLSPLEGPNALIWPTTAFALGGALWLVGEQVWQEWGWQIPVSVGALALIGVPFTPGFLTQPFLARLATLDSILVPYFLTFIIAQTLQVAALLRSLGAKPKRQPSLVPGTILRLIAAIVLLALPLAIAGINPRAVTALASMPAAIPQDLGNPPSAVAGPSVWITLGLPLLLGIGVAMLRPRFWPYLGSYPDRLSRLASLEWIAEALQVSANGASSLWERTLSVVEGGGYVGWAAAILFLTYLLLR